MTKQYAERDQFEAWFADHSGQTIEWVKSQRETDKHYKIGPEIQRFWMAWQASRAAQPATPALKLPDPFSPHDAKMFCAAHGVTGSYELASQMANYAVDKVVRLNSPHTAPIEPICATGGAEWVKPVPRKLKQVLLELRTYNPKADEYGGKHIIPGWADRIEKALGIKPAAPEEE